MISLRMDKLRISISMQMLLSEDCVVEDINPTRASETSINILLIFLLIECC